MTINITITHQWPQGQPGGITVRDLINSELRTKETIMASTQETLDALGTVVEKLNKVKAESEATRAAVDTLNARVNELQLLLDNQSIPQSITDAIAAVSAAAQAVDEVVPDASA